MDYQLIETCVLNSTSTKYFVSFSKQYIAQSDDLYITFYECLSFYGPPDGMADPTLLRDITIKTGVVKRLVKELCYYEKEEEKLKSKLHTMQGGDAADEHIIKKQMELLQETKQMIPECVRRLTNSIESLKKVTGEHETVLQNTPEYIAAAEQIKTGTEECLKIKEAARVD
ncbi:unnamed protein product [Litomosoides sigmodontis]|uniref:Tubulin-specific chaperone A n=1 Tax=Litomosoides sigmodontis TaxID=42156 RepID=A0A3P6U0I9_LITSI|nr:unnamed protein product [Litomosoides sigmodontis]